MFFLSLAAMVAMAAMQPGQAGTPGGSQPTVAAPDVRPALNPLATQFDIVSNATGRTYRISVARPSGTPPENGWPVIYVLDGDITFATVASQNMLRSAYGEAGAVIVGVGYSDPAAALVMRNRDLTPSEPTEAGRKLGLLGEVKPGDYGGGAAFAQFMTAELKPVIAALAPVDANAETLMGYSYGGLFTLGMLFKNPAAYETYVIGSPSIWWNEREVLDGEQAFAQRVRSGEVSPRVLLTSGELEQDPDSVKLPSDPAQRAGVIDAIAREKMVENAKALAGRLQSIKGSAGYRVEYVVFDGETHLSGIPAAVSRGYFFAMQP